MVELGDIRQQQMEDERLQRAKERNAGTWSRGADWAARF